MKPDVTPEQREEIHALKTELITMVKAPQSHFSPYLCTAIEKAAADRKIHTLRCYKKFLTRNRSLTSIDWMLMVLESYEDAPKMIDLTEEQVDAFLSLDSYLSKISYNTLERDRVCLLLLEDLSRDQEIRRLCDRRLPEDEVKAMLTEMSIHTPVLREGML